MNAREELFAKFFKSGYEKGLTIEFTVLDDWIIELENIAIEAKATLQGASDAKKTRVDKLSADQRDKLITRPDLTGSDAINAVNRRKARMTAADKLAETLSKMGLDDKDIKSTMGTIKPDEISQAIANQNMSNGNGKLKPVEIPKVEQAVESKLIEVKPKEDSGGFDPSKLFG